MIGIGFLIASVITLALFIFWCIFIARISLWEYFANSSLARYLFIIFFITLPFHSAYVYPLLKIECDMRGGNINTSNGQAISNDLQVNGAMYEDTDESTITNLFSTGIARTINFSADSSYGNSDFYKSAISRGKNLPYRLHLADKSDVTCGPYYSLISNGKRNSSIGNVSCIAIDGGELPINYLKIFKTTERELSWRTAFQPISWNVLRAVQVNERDEKIVYERRSFQHKGLMLPLFMDGFLENSGIGRYSCKNDSSTYQIISELVTKRDKVELGTEITPVEAGIKLNELTSKFWGFDIPDAVRRIQVWVFEYSGLSSKDKPLNINVNVAKDDLPTLLVLNSNSSAIWNIKNTNQSNEIYVESYVPKEGAKVNGVPEVNTWIFNDERMHSEKMFHFYYWKDLFKLKIGAIGTNLTCEKKFIAKERDLELDLSSCLNPPEKFIDSRVIQ